MKINLSGFEICFDYKNKRIFIQPRNPKNENH
jgi:hypothetical protein